MAKSHSSSEDYAKVKLRVIDFELEGANASVENSIRQLTQAFSARPLSVPPKNIPAARPVKELAGSQVEDIQVDSQAELDFQEPEVEILETSKPAKSKPSRAPSKARVPQYLHDLDMNGTGNLTFKDFTATKKPKNNNQRHLVCAFWLKEYGNSPTITPDKAYSCYRNVGWPTNMNDWDGNFRQQIQNNRVRRVNPGEYAINPPGEDDVRKMDGAE